MPRRRQASRFRPPALEIPAALRWILVRALGPQGAVAPAPGGRGPLLELVRGSSLGPLVGERHSLERLASEVGSRAAARLKLETESARRAAGALLGMLPAIGDAARAAEASVVPLKFAALTLGGHVPPGTRTAGDVDVLVDPEAGDRIAGILAGAGFRSAGFRDGTHQLPQLVDGEGRRLELHRHVPGLRVPGAPAPATAAALEAAGATHVVSFDHGSRSRDWTVPGRDVLLAHALVHGIAQHGLQPQGYPLFRMVADLVALDAGGDDLEKVQPWICGDVADDESRAALVLAERLGRGDPTVFDASGPPSPDQVLLRHLTASLTDRDYQRSLRLSGGGAVTALRHPGTLARRAWRAVALTEAQVDLLYGRPRSPWGYTVRRLLRPFDLVVRAARYAASALRVRFRS